MSEKFVLIDLNDEKSKKISEIIGNSTCKKIIEYLSEEKEASEKDIADRLNIPINTVEYNLKKLVEVGLAEKTKNFFWSVKGKKIDMYRIANKKIIISTKRLVKGVVPAFIGVFLVSFGIKLWSDKINSVDLNNAITSADNIVRSTASEAAGSLQAGSGAASATSSAAPVVADKVAAASTCVNNICPASEIWAWFLLGGLFVILIFLLWNYFYKNERRFN